MSDQSNQAPQSVLTPDELRQAFLDQLSAEQKNIQELDDEELETIAGGASVDVVTHVTADLSHSSDSFHSVSSSHSTGEGGTPAGTPIQHTKRGIPKAWQAASAGIAAGGVGSVVVGAIAGKLGV